MLNVVKHLECAHVDVHEILRCAQDDNFAALRMTIHLLFFANQFCFTINELISAMMKKRIKSIHLICGENKSAGD